MRSYIKSDKKKVVLDTNILISALISKYGQPSKLFEKLILGKIENYTSKEIIEELKDVLKRKEITKRTDKKSRNFILKKYKEFSLLVVPKEKLKIVTDDIKDDKFIECAVEADADYIVSGDLHLLKIKKYKHIRIISPKESEKIF